MAEALLGADEETAGNGVPGVLGLVGLADDEAKASGVCLVELVRVVLRLEVHAYLGRGGDGGIIPGGSRCGNRDCLAEKRGLI